MHTPGPWTTSGDTYPIGILAPHRFGAGDPEVVCQIGNDIMTPEDPEECEANARLIAAAPDLLAALEYIVAWNPEGWSAEQARDAANAAIRKARVAINAPSGESEVR